MLSACARTQTLHPLRVMYAMSSTISRFAVVELSGTVPYRATQQPGIGNNTKGESD